MTIVARCNGTLLVEEGDRLGVVEQGGGWIPVAVFVAGLLAFLLLVNGIVLVVISGLVGIALVGGAILPGAALVALLRLRRRRRAAGSSSKALALRHPGGRIVLARGNPFGDSIDAVEHALRRALA